MATVIKRRAKFSDSFTNATYKLGLGTDNPLSSATYSLNNLLSRDRTTLEAGYRSSWLIGQAVDTVAEDMTKMGIDMFSKMSPDDIKKLHVCINDYSVWESYCQIIKWARLYGGALGVIIIDGADYSKPMNLEAIGKDTFKGILVLDRWMCEPVLTELIEEFGKDFAKPKYYRIHSSVANLKLPDQKIHYSRIMRFDGVSLPFYQRIYENHWGLSVVERIYDRLISYDSATLGASQLMYKSFLRIVGINGLREALALGGKEESAIIKMFEMIRQYQSNEGITLLDKDDSFSVQSNTFGGAADLLRQFSEQISGATGIPLVRLFGQSPSGFSTGDADLRNYYDNINREQENKLRPHLTKLLEIICKSKLGKSLPEDFEYKFISLWQMSDKEKSEIFNADVNGINTAFQGGLASKEMAVKELLQLSRTTGRFTNITEDDIDKAKEEDANQPPPGMMPEEPPEGTAGAEQNEGVDLTAKTPESYQEQSIKSPLEGREESINAREQETQRDEIESPTLPIKPLSEVISTNVMKNNSVIANVRSVIKENIKAAAKSVYQKFFSKDAEEYNYHTVWKKFKEYANSKGFTQKVVGDEAFTNKRGQICRYKSSKYGKDITVYEEGVGVHTIDADFEESEHPRAKSGEFIKKGSGSSEVSKSKSETETKKSLGRSVPDSKDEKNLKRTIDSFNNFIQQGVRKRTNLKYSTGYDVVDKHGKFFTFKERPKDVKQGTMRQCYRNAGYLAIEHPDKYTYVEGFAYPKAINGYPFAHAWCIDKEGNVVDPTWKDGAAYFGVPFTKDYLLQTILKTGMWGLIPEMVTEKYNPFENGFPENAFADTGETKDSIGNDSLISEEELNSIKDPAKDNKHYYHIEEALDAKK